MTNIDKAILLASEVGAPLQNFDYSYIKDILASDSYLTLVDNVRWARQFKLNKSIALEDDFKSLNYDVKTIEQSVVLASRINFLASISYENYYINPLVKYDFEVKTKTIGDIAVFYNEKYHYFNDLINADEFTLDYKIKVISTKCEEYIEEITLKTQNDLNLTKENKGIRSIVIKTKFISLLRFLVSVLFTLVIFFVFIWEDQVFYDYINIHSTNNVYTYLISIFILSTALMDIFAILLLSYSAISFYPYYHFKHELTRKFNRRVKKISKKANALASYMLECVKSKQKMDKKLNEFSTDVIKQEEFENYKEMYNFDSKIGYKLLRYFFVLFLIVSSICLILALIIYFVSKNVG